MLVYCSTAVFIDLSLSVGKLFRRLDWNPSYYSCVGVMADALVPLVAVMADLRRLKDSRQCSHHMIVEYG